MQTLNLSSTPPRSDSRLKALFWPTIRHEGDLEYITEQGFWICLVIAIGNLVFSILQQPIESCLNFSFFFFAGVGIRERSLGASIAVFVVYLAGRLALWRLSYTSYSLVALVFTALLLANVRGIWLSNEWAKQNELPPVERLNDTFFDKLSGGWPQVLWPRAKYLFALLALIELIGTGMMLAHPPSFGQLESSFR